MSKEGISKLRLHDEMSWIEFVLDTSKWVIQLKWQNGQLLFYKEWINLSKLLNLKEGDKFVLVRGINFQQIKVAILEKIDGSKSNEKGSVQVLVCII